MMRSISGLVARPAHPSLATIGRIAALFVDASSALSGSPRFPSRRPIPPPQQLFGSSLPDVRRKKAQAHPAFATFTLGCRNGRA